MNNPGEQAAAGLRRAEKALRDTVVRAPFAGRVAARLVDEGALIRRMPPTVTLVLVAIDPIEVEGSVGERELRYIRAGLPVEVRVDAVPGQVLQGRVETVAPSLDPVTRRATVRARVPNPGPLRDGMTGAMRILAGEQSGVVVPRRAFVRLEAGRGLLFVVEDGGRAASREVHVAGPGADRVVVAEGLAPGDAVVVAGQDRLEGGERVRVVESPT